ncbi:unnamed protein product [Gongylonema pulchrum]|uniref:Uncharacterized protein n=2 Tax=Gongylonema pulchrum TaxID=637853 RepID=A0A3P7RL33_9BILA|nr:unnamed protein product [Gongylonema pulchrum]
MLSTVQVREIKTKHMSPCSNPVSFRADQAETFVSDADLPHCVDALSVAEMQRMRKLAFLKLSAMIETHAGAGVRIDAAVADGNDATAGSNAKSWAVQRFIRRMRNNDTNNSNNNNKPTRSKCCFSLVQSGSVKTRNIGYAAWVVYVNYVVRIRRSYVRVFDPELHNSS